VARVGIEASRVILTTTPGGEASQAALSVWHNEPGRARVQLSVQGLDPAWYCLTPTEFLLPPNEKGTARLEVCAPTDTPLGLYAVTVVATLEAVDVGGYPEATVAAATLPLALWVEAPDGLLFPVGGKGRRALVRFQNGCQAPWAVRLQAASSDEALDIQVEPEVLVVPPGGTAEAQLHLRPRHRALTGRVQAHQFTLTVLSATEEQPVPLLQLPCEIRSAPPPAIPACLAPVLLWPGRRLPVMRGALAGAWPRLKPPALRGLDRMALLLGALLPPLLAVWLLVAGGLGRRTAAPVAAPSMPGAVPSQTAQGEVAARSSLMPPVIGRFTAEPAAVTPGTTVLLHWETAGAERLFLNGQPVAPAGTIELVPQSTGEYVLQAENAAGATMQRLQVLVEVSVVEAVPEIAPQDDAPVVQASGGPSNAPPRGSAPARQPPRVRPLPSAPSAGAVQPVAREAAQPMTELVAPAAPPALPEAQPPAPAPEAARGVPAPASADVRPGTAVDGPSSALAPAPTPASVAVVTLVPAELRAERRDAEPPALPTRSAASGPAPPAAPAQPPQPARSATPAPAATAPTPRPQATRAPDPPPDPCSNAKQERCKANDRQGPDRQRDGHKNAGPSRGDRDPVRSAVSTVVRGGAETLNGAVRGSGRAP